MNSNDSQYKDTSTFLNKNNRIVVKFNDNALAEEMKKQAPKKLHTELMLIL